MEEKGTGADSIQAGLVCGAHHEEHAIGAGVYKIQCVGVDGLVKWEETFDNLVTNEGRQFMNNKFFAGTSYTATWYVGLISGTSASFADSDTFTTKSWTEFTAYSAYATTGRPQITFGTATLGSPSVITNPSATAYTINGAGGNVYGAFLCSAATGTPTTLFSEAGFSSPGARAVVANDTLNVTYTFSLS